MELNEQITKLVMNNLQYVLLGMTAMILVALIIFININIKLTRLNRRYERMMQGMEEVNVETLLLTHVDQVRAAVAKVERLSDDCRRLDTITRGCIQNVGIVRFNAFEDTGSDLSFALALLDAKNNGVVLSSIYGRNESRVYAKPIIDSQSTYYLTDEEKEALQKAKEKVSK